MKKLSILALIALMLTSCAKIFYSPDAFTIAHSHKTIALLPPTVAITGRKKDNLAAIKEQQKTESVNFHKAMYAWMQKRNMQGKIRVQIQDVETTLAKLKQAGFPEKPLTPSELCSLLEVDGLISSNYSMTKPISEGAALAAGLLVGAWVATNEVTVSMSIHDGKEKKLIWNFDHKYAGSVGSTPARLVDQLMRNASKKMPYLI